MLLRKIGLGKKTRIIIFGMLGLLLAGSFYFLYRAYREPLAVKRDLPVYSFRHQGKLDYNVQVKPNSVFDEEIMGPGKSYYANLVKSIDANCSYSYTADQPAKLTAAYSIVAVVEEPEVWAKEFPLVPETVVDAEGKEISFSLPFSFNLESYEKFLEGVNEQLGVVAREPIVTIGARINVVAETADGQASGELIPSMVIPLGAGEFEITGTMSPRDGGALTKATLVPNPGLKGRRTKAVFFSGVLLLLGVTFVLLTEVREPAAASSVDNFWRKYGDRLVKAGSDFMVPDDLILISLCSIEDLIKVADEAGKPIIYQNRCFSQSTPACFVIDGLTAYKHPLQASQLPKEVTSSPNCRQVEQDELSSC